MTPDDLRSPIDALACLKFNVACAVASVSSAKSVLAADERGRSAGTGSPRHLHLKDARSDRRLPHVGRELRRSELIDRSIHTRAKQ
jgi:hypothetical protein